MNKKTFTTCSILCVLLMCSAVVLTQRATKSSKDEVDNELKLSPSLEMTPKEKKEPTIVLNINQNIDKESTIRDLDESISLKKKNDKTGLPNNPLRLLRNSKGWSAVAGDISKRYSVRLEYAEHWVAEIVNLSEKKGLDPYLVMAIVETESRFMPEVVSNMGAMGLMQVIPKWHPAAISMIGGHAQMSDPVSNLRAGVDTIKKYMNLANGNTTRALLMYNGSLKDPSQKYAKAVLSKRARWMAIAGNDFGVENKHVEIEESNRRT